MATRKTKPNNRLETEPLSVSVTPGVYVLIEKLTDTHFFGRTCNETASLILSAEVKRIIMSGELDNLIARAPTVVPLKAPETDAGSDEGDSGT